MWSHEFIFPTVREHMEPALDLVRDYLTSDYDFPTAIAAMRRDIEAASAEILEGLSGEPLEEMRAANEINLRMAPLTPDHHFYIDQGANAHVRLVLMAIGRKLVEAGRLDAADDVMFLRYNELRMLIGDAAAVDGRGIVAARRARARGRRADQAARLGRDRHPVPARVPLPRQLGLPGAVPPGPVGRGRGGRPDRRASPGRRASSRASRASCGPSTSSTRSPTATSSCAR